MPNIQFVPTRMNFGLSVKEMDDGSKDSLILSYSVKPFRPSRNEVRLSTGDKFENLEGTLSFRCERLGEDVLTVPKTDILGNEKPGETVKATGLLTYWGAIEDELDPHPAAYFAEVWLKPEIFEHVLSTARLGKMPSQISIQVVGGIKIGWEPDGSGKEWDNKDHPNLPIISVSMDVYLGVDPSSVEESADFGEPALDDFPPTRAQIVSLENQMRQISNTLNKLPTKIFFVGLLLVALHLLFA
ncbi:MAG: hypothetical protein KIT13_11770 [Burkholderiales bacterium]|nr:hypothetical protein [Burkholderiales bacterium]